MINHVKIVVLGITLSSGEYDENKCELTVRKIGERATKYIVKKLSKD